MEQRALSARVACQACARRGPFYESFPAVIWLTVYRGRQVELREFISRFVVFVNQQVECRFAIGLHCRSHMPDLRTSIAFVIGVGPCICNRFAIGLGMLRSQNAKC